MGFPSYNLRKVCLCHTYPSTLCRRAFHTCCVAMAPQPLPSKSDTGEHHLVQRQTCTCSWQLKKPFSTKHVAMWHTYYVTVTNYKTVANVLIILEKRERERAGHIWGSCVNTLAYVGHVAHKKAARIISSIGV